MRGGRQREDCPRDEGGESVGSQEVRALLVGRKLLQAKLLDVELSIRGILRGFGLNTTMEEAA